MSGVVKYGTPWMTFAEVTSTNDLARDWAKAGADAGTLITATHQTSGRGRRGRSWDDAEGQSAIMTFIARPALGPSEYWKLPYAVSLATALAVREGGVPTAALKWPNDVVANGKKLAGVLVETVATDGGAAALLGIGVNVAQSDFGDASEYALAPTSLRPEGGTVMVNAVVESVARHLTMVMPLVAGSAGEWAELMRQWAALAVFDIVLSGAIASGEVCEGVLRGVNASDGSARLETASGNVIAVWPR